MHYSLHINKLGEKVIKPYDGKDYDEFTWYYVTKRNSYALIDRNTGLQFVLAKDYATMVDVYKARSDLYERTKKTDKYKKQTEFFNDLLAKYKETNPQEDIVEKVVIKEPIKETTKEPIKTSKKKLF